MAGTRTRSARLALAAVMCGAGLMLGAPEAGAAVTPIGAWETRASTLEERYNPAAFAVTGGLFVIDSLIAAAAATGDRYDEASDSWTTVGRPGGAHDHRLRAAGLSGSRVVVVGGGSSAVDVWDAASGWSSLPAMSVTRNEPAVLELSDGRILVVGSDGYSGAALTAEVYSPSTNLWTSTAPPAQSGAAFAGLLPDGRALVLFGGFGAVWDGAIWNPATDTWTQIPRVTSGRATMSGGTAILVAVNDGDTSTWRYDVALNEWVRLGDRALSRYNPALTTLADGRVLIASGRYTDFDGQGERSAEILGSDGTWAPTGRLSTGRLGASLVATGGRAYVVGGGYAGGDALSVERFDPAATPPSYQPAIRAFRDSYEADRQSRMQVRAQAVDLATYLPIANTKVQMSVQPGGASPSGTPFTCPAECRTDSGGRVVATYANTTAAGNDTVRAHLDLDGDTIMDSGEPTGDATIPWTMRTTAIASSESYAVYQSTVGVGAILAWTWKVDCSVGGYGGNCRHYNTPLAGRTLEFYTLSGEFLCSAVTGPDGIGRCGLPTHKLAVIQANGQRVVFRGDALHNSSIDVHYE